MKTPLNDRLVFLIEYLNLQEATGDPNANWESYQVQFLNNTDILTCDNKSRQVGWSFIAAAEAVADSVLVPRATNIFVSVTQVEAAEKVRYANYCIDALDKEVRPEKLIDNRTEVELANGSRIISHPCRPPRGKARARVYLDEIAHYPRDEEIYTAAVPIITRGGVIRMGSSPLGASGKFWEIYTQSLQPYPGYTRMAIPWWIVAHLCSDLKRAAKDAPLMPTRDRVAEFGTDRLIHIFENMALEDFQQEYECDWTDESVAWITWEEIKRNQIDASLDLLWHELVEVDESNVEYAYDAIESVAGAVQRGDVEPVLSGGMDIGRKKNLSELILLGTDDTGVEPIYPYRLGLSLDRLEFREQFSIVAKVLDTLPVDRFLVDDMGLGMQLAEDLETRYPTVVEGLHFTNDNKADMAVETKLRFQQSRSPIPLDRNLGYQIHSIKRRVTAGKRLVYDTEANEKHHADKFWALALAHMATVEAFDFAVSAVNPLAGYRG
jgi:phage FluMu gp28-like protein